MSLPDHAMQLGANHFGTSKWFSIGVCKIGGHVWDVLLPATKLAWGPCINRCLLIIAFTSQNDLLAVAQTVFLLHRRNTYIRL